MREPIRSRRNPLLVHIGKLLRSATYRRESNEFVLEGLRMIEQALLHDSRPRRLKCELWSESAYRNARPDSRNAPLHLVDDEVFQRVSDTRHSQGVMAVMTRPDIEAPRPAAEPKGLWLALDRLGDPGNVGTLMRSAAAAGAHGVLLYGTTADPFNPKALRASAGAFAALDIRVVNDAVMDQWLDAGWMLAAATAHAAISLYDLTFPERLMLAVGHETDGLSDTLKQRAASTFFIPMQEPCESLNAGVAGSLALFEWRRRQVI